MIFPFEGRLWVFFFFPSCANLFLKERRTGVVPTDLSPSSSSSSSRRSGDDDVNDDDRGSRVDPCTLKEVCRPTTKKSLKKRRRMDAVRLSSSIVHKMGETQTIQKEVQTCLGFWIIIFFLIFLRACALCWRILFLGTPKLTTTKD